MNHIRALTAARDGLSLQLKTLYEGILDLEEYLYSNKFSVDTTVQVKDVLTRLSEAKRRSNDAREDFDSMVHRTELAEEEKKAAKGKASCERCGKYGYDWELAKLHGYSQLLCSKCFTIARHNKEITE